MRARGSIFLLFLLSGCNLNLFQFFDVPSSDEQKLSKARACLDRGDYTCAAYEYSQVTTLNSETAAAENAFTTLRQEGAGLAVISQAAARTLTSGGAAGGGAFLTALAGELSYRSPGAAKRQSLQTAYARVSAIPTSNALRGLVRFLSASALVAEILAETMSVRGTLSITDLVSSSSTCSAIVCGVPPSGCDPPTANTLSDGTALNSTTIATADLSGAPTIGMIHGGIDGILLATSNAELGSANGLASAVGGFAGVFSSAAGFVGTPSGSPCYRQLLISNGVGN